MAFEVGPLRRRSRHAVDWVAVALFFQVVVGARPTSSDSGGEHRPGPLLRKRGLAPAARLGGERAQPAVNRSAGRAQLGRALPAAERRLGHDGGAVDAETLWFHTVPRWRRNGRYSRVQIRVRG